MSSRLWGTYVAGVGAAGVVYSLQTDPAALDLVWLVVAWSAVAAIVAGIVVHRPARPGPWRLTTAGLTATAVAGLVAPASLDFADGSVRASVGDVLHLCSYLMIGGAVLWFMRLQTPDGDRDSLVDGVVVTVALATVLWSVVIDPTALGAQASWSTRLVYVVAPLLPAGITSVCIRLLFASGSRLVSARLLGGAWILAFLGTVGWILMLQADAFAPGGWADLLWIGALGCAGASALHPSMVAMTRPAATTPRTLSGSRLTVLGIALLATPAALLPVAGTAGVHAVAPVAGAGLIALLVLGRLARLVHERDQDRRELETRAARQEVVARVGNAALTERPIESLYAEAAALITGVLEGVRASVRPTEDVDALDAEPTRLLALPISTGDRTWATLDVVAGERGVLTADECAFLTSVTAVLSGVASRRHAEDSLRRQALYDGLTGLPNRILVLERLGHAVTRRERGPVGVLFVDLDGFKPVNDEHGHETGDALLTALAARLPDVLRTGDTVGRLAGDEFVVVAPECDVEGLTELAGRLLAAVVEPVEVDGVHLSVGASIGGTIAGTGDRSPQEVLRRADAAMYEAKDAGGGTVLAPALR